ncbi:hypothetical protein E3N88_15186 [Mikania micrantha]|uniref:Uncharacterized protein n=1 Tax=Mikania micrantha TaxID=192012 RepID=A0A5N6NXH5_9ASTR|nr:hypothetical protein E3N88_15186 [Mikania micrantha]
MNTKLVLGQTLFSAFSFSDFEALSRWSSNSRLRSVAGADVRSTTSIDLDFAVDREKLRPIGSWNARNPFLPSEGRSYSSEATLFPKDNSLLLKAVQDNCFGRSTLGRNSTQKLPKRKASSASSLTKTFATLSDKDYC